MKFFKTETVIYDPDTDQNANVLVDTVYYEGNWWLCPPPLLRSLATGEIIPQRLILTGVAYVKLQEVNHPDYRFLLSNSIPKSVFDGKTEGEYIVALYQAPSDSQRRH